MRYFERVVPETSLLREYRYTYRVLPARGAGAAKSLRGKPYCAMVDVDAVRSVAPIVPGLLSWKLPPRDKAEDESDRWYMNLDARPW